MPFSDPGGGAPDADAVALAARRLHGWVRRTPVVRCDELDDAAGARLWLKAENLQRGGSFKIRGALLAVAALATAGSRGVVAQSTGNHAIAVALAAGEHRLPATLVVPTDVADVKVRRIRSAGAEVVTAGGGLAGRLAAVAELREAHGYDVVDPYEDPRVVAGHGTATVELLRQVREAGGRLDAVVVPIGGGSAVAGACLAVAACPASAVAVVGAEPEAVPAFTAALRARRPVTVDAAPTIADGLRPERIGSLPFELAHRRVAGVVTVSETAIADALRAALLHARLVVEPAGATALAVALARAREFGEDVGVLLSGGNVDAAVVAEVLAG